MLNRIKQIIDKEKLSSTQFATEIGVQRSALSHVLSGRNKPSLDFMMKIKNRYPEINLDWLLLGKGRMVGGKETREVRATAVVAKDKAQEPKEVQFRIKKDEVDEITEDQKIGIKITEQKQKETKAGSPKKIILLYPDDTYETYDPR